MNWNRMALVVVGILIIASTARVIYENTGERVEKASEMQLAVAQGMINCNTIPFLPSGWKIVKHQKGGMWEWDSTKVGLYLSDGQKNNGAIDGHKLFKELVGRPVLNANVLDFLLIHQELIPVEWRGLAVFFWGTVYRNYDGDCVVPYIYWDSGRWLWGDRQFDSGWDVNTSPAAVLLK